MRKRVILTLIEGSFEQGFPVILRIKESSTLHETEVPGRLPAAPNVLRAFNHWQLAYDHWQSTYRIRPKPDQVNNYSCREIASLGSQLAECFNEWLNSDSSEWRIIRDELQRSLSETDEIRFIIQTEDMRLRQLPWHLWDLFSEHYIKAEIALSAPHYRSLPPPNPTNQVRILAILGDSTGINVDQDIAILKKQLPDAEIVALTQPQLQVLNHQLWEQHWDILFFAGHSASQADGSTGQIYINQDDSLSLRDLRNALRRAISSGLQLAIFNSCDGLGLAQELADLNIPQTIVMRKPVPDEVAQEFLRHFLRGFASGASLYLAVREARERLQGLEARFPCASWLPVICQNPTQEPLTWQGMKNSPFVPLTRQWRFLKPLLLGVLTTVLVIILQLLILQRLPFHNGDIISLECQGDIAGSTLLDVVTENGINKVVLATDKLSPGIKWKVHVYDDKNRTIALENQGNFSNLKWLDGLTRAGDVNLAPNNTSKRYSGTKWKVYYFNLIKRTIKLENKGEAGGLTWLDGETATGKVKLAEHTNGSNTGTEWKIIKQ